MRKITITIDKKAVINIKQSGKHFANFSITLFKNQVLKDLDLNIMASIYPLDKKIKQTWMFWKCLRTLLHICIKLISSFI